MSTQSDDFIEFTIKLDRTRVEELTALEPIVPDLLLHFMENAVNDAFDRVIIGLSKADKPQASIEQTAWVLKHVLDHMNEGGTYRYLIYDRLGFTALAYEELLEPGLSISNLIYEWRESVKTAGQHL